MLIRKIVQLGENYVLSFEQYCDGLLKQLCQSSLVKFE